MADLFGREPTKTYISVLPNFEHRSMGQPAGSDGDDLALAAHRAVGLELASLVALAKAAAALA